MTATFVREGRLDQAGTVITAKTANLRCKLWTAISGTVSVTTVLADLTEATFSGYSAVTPTWGSAAIDGNGNSLSAGSTCTFTHNGGGTSNSVKGYYVVDVGTGKLQFVEEFSAPITLSANGQFVSVTPNYYFGQISPPL